jgi:HEAT repeat protein
MNEKRQLKKMMKDLMAFPNHTAYLERNPHLFDMKKPKTIDALIFLLELPEREVQCAAARLLGHMKAERAVPKLIELLHHNDLFVRKEAIRALGEIAHIAAVPHLVAIARKNTTPQSSWALGEIGDKRAVDTLVDQLAFSRDFRTVAAKALAKLGDTRWIKIIDGSNDDYDRLARCHDDRPIKAATAYLYEGKYASHCKDIAMGFGSIRDPSDEITDALIHCISHEDGAVRIAAITSLAAHKSVKAADAVIRALSDPDHQVYEAAAYTLGEIGDPRACPHLIRVIDGKSGVITKNAAQALVKLKCKEAIAPLKAFVDGDSFLKNTEGLVAHVEEAIRQLESF